MPGVRVTLSFFGGWRQESDKENALRAKTVFFVIPIVQRCQCHHGTNYNHIPTGRGESIHQGHHLTMLHRSLPVTLDQFKRTSVQLLEVSGRKTWMLFLSDYRPNKVNVTDFRIKQGFKTSLAALLPPPE